MKFDVVIGNPPYQLTNEKTSDTPIYHLFMESAYAISDKSILITPARFLFNAGKTPKDWNEKMLNDKHFKVLQYKGRSSDYFPNVDIMGGVCISLRDYEKDFGKIISFTPFAELNKILKKVKSSQGFSSLSDIIYAQNKFCLDILYADYPEYRNIVGSQGRERRLTTSIFNQLDVFRPTDDGQGRTFRILGLIGNSRVYRYIACKYIERNENILKYKVVIPKSNGSGAIGVIESTPIIGIPQIGPKGTGYTQSFIGLGAFDKQSDAESALKYVKTKFARTLLGVLKITQDNSKEVWRFVPLQDFTTQSDIDWTRSIPDIDRQLYRKYGLSAEEIQFIEKNIKPME